MNGIYPVPDTRFEQTFRRALTREAEKQRTVHWKKMGVVDPVVINQLQKMHPPVISNLTIFKVIVRDVLLMPFVQGMLWTSILIIMRPWLGKVVTHGRKMGSSIYKLVLGTDLIKSKKLV